MLGLIKKDLLIIKSNLKLVTVMLLVFFVMALQGQFDMSFILTFIIVMLFISTFSYDEYNKWDAYAITLPGGRKNVVKSKYIAGLLLTTASVVVTILLNYLVYIITNDLDFNKFISTLIGSCFAIILIQAIVYPLIFKYGMEKGRVLLFVLAFVFVGVIELFSKVVNITIPTNIVSFFDSYWFIIVPIILILILFTSYKISDKIYSKKEF